MAAEVKRMSDSELEQAVLSQIRQTPGLGETDIKVETNRGVITLSGVVSTESERAAIEAAAKEVWGVQAIANDLLVRSPKERSGSDIAKSVLNAFHANILIPASDILVIVRNGHVKLEGKVHYELQRMLAEALVRRVRGIAGVSNQLDVKFETPSLEITRNGQRQSPGLGDESDWVGETEAA